MFDAQTLRQSIRQKRRQLHPHALKRREQQVARLLLRLPIMQKAQHIAAYWPSDGELSPIAAVTLLRAQGKNIYFPCIAAKKRMIFRPWFANTALRTNRYGILEPASRRVFSARKLDVVLTPLVAFDANGNRIGMGAGFYDRAFAFRQQNVWCLKPQLVGIAHNFQHVPTITRNHWDIPLSFIQTETRLFKGKPRH